MIDENFIQELLRTTTGGNLHHREGQELEFKEQFNLAGLADYFRDFAAFSNNKGGYLIFGVSDTPRKLKGLTEASLNQFEKIDPEKITGFLLDIFLGNISWEQETYEYKGKSFGIFKIYPSSVKPIIAKKNEGKDQIITNGDIYYRYGGRTQKIQYAELETIINKRIEQNNNQWLDLMSKIGKAGPSNAAILDTEKSVIEKDDTKILVIDEELAKKLKFIKEGEFVEKKGATTLKLVGDIVPIDRIEVVKKVKENLLKEYPYSAKGLVVEVKKQLSTCTENQIWEAIKDNDLKNNTNYSAYNFRNKKHEDEFKATSQLPNGTPSIYNSKAVDFIVRILRSKE
ncbi:MAG TPA: ATP-binding protein [Hanamia sp.]|nr:ATP-binding protein [Hanamia sp.]